MPARAFCRAGLPGSMAAGGWNRPAGAARPAPSPGLASPSVPAPEPRDPRGCPPVLPAPLRAGNVPTEAFERSRGTFPFWGDGNVPRHTGECSIGTIPCDPPPPKPAEPPHPGPPRRAAPPRPPSTSRPTPAPLDEPPHPGPPRRAAPPRPPRRRPTPRLNPRPEGPARRATPTPPLGFQRLVSLPPRSPQRTAGERRRTPIARRQTWSANGHRATRTTEMEYLQARLGTFWPRKAPHLGDR